MTARNLGHLLMALGLVSVIAVLSLRVVSADDPAKAKAANPPSPALPLASTPSLDGSKESRATPENWDDLISQYERADAKERANLDTEIREMVTSLAASAQKAIDAGDEKAALASFERAIGLIHQMLRTGHPQAWMYQALSLSMKACKYPNEEVERCMLSSLDFGATSAEAMAIAEYFARNQMKAEALSLLHDTSIIDPYNQEIYALAMPLARELNDLSALRWSCAGVLSKAWPAKYDRLADDARLLARATSLRLRQSGRVAEATAFEFEIKDALRRDLVVRVTWTGEADIAMRVKEPVGTVCSYSNPHSLSGGVLLGHASSNRSKDALNGISDYYVCPQGYAGEYEILLRRLWGKVAGGKATVEILSDFGTPDQKSVVQQVDINEKDAIIRVAVKQGHRKEPIAQTDLASIQKLQKDLSRAVLSQFAGAPSSGSSSSSSGGYANPYAAMQALLAAGGGINNNFPIRGAVGYRPVIQTIPEGASMFVTGVVSADRRYVRITPSPNFSQIGEVFTYNFVDGQTAGGAGTTGGTGAGAGGGGGGFGNGGGGGVF